MSLPNSMKVDPDPARRILADKKRVLILCTGNSARSQMAEGLFRHDAGDSCDVFSAGTNPTAVRQEAIAVMSEIGIDISGHHSKSVDEFVGQKFDYVITVCDHARELCQSFRARRSTCTGALMIRQRRKGQKKNERRRSAESETSFTNGLGPS
jgi:protein-tyrosine-phosphatase